MRKTSTIVASKTEVLWEPYNTMPYEDDIIMKSDGVVAEVNSLIFNNILGKNLLEVIENKNQESNLYF